jgi:hypothetical protein
VSIYDPQVGDPNHGKPGYDAWRETSVSPTELPLDFAIAIGGRAWRPGPDGRFPVCPCAEPELARKWCVRCELPNLAAILRPAPGPGACPVHPGEAAPCEACYREATPVDEVWL